MSMARARKKTVAVLAVQGAFVEHERRLRSLGAQVVELRQAADLERPFDALVLPGGESTAQSKLVHELGMFEALVRRIASGMPTLGTCAGLILLARRVDGTGDLDGLPDEEAGRRVRVAGFGTLPCAVRRNAYGRQLGSFHATAPFAGLGELPMTFIRAPFVEELGPGAEELARVDGHVVAVRAGNQLGVAFHPELDSDPALHELLLEL